MLSDKEYMSHSLELNLFFLRIIKEHIIFAAPALPPKNLDLTNMLIEMKGRFEKLLDRTVDMSLGIVSPEVLASGELVTKFTLPAEEKTQSLTGIPIDMSITKKQLGSRGDNSPGNISPMVSKVSELNKEIIGLMNLALTDQENLLKDVLICKAFSYIYPLMLDHVIREGHFYVMMLSRLEKRDELDSVRKMIEEELNWNRIMHEHSEFIRGYLDPSEDELIQTADKFAVETEKLVAETETLPSQPANLPGVTRQSLNLVTNLRNFKLQGVAGILGCKIKSIIPPLLGDHVLREANHYLRLLKTL
ncbi:MAG: hypothetical protein K0R09_3057 [Clostridiales bacterium]|nr:hypothetical protein [Clostridiales bacterium]